MAVSSSSLLLALRASWRRKTLTLLFPFAFTTSFFAVCSLSCLSSNTFTNKYYSLLHHLRSQLPSSPFVRYHVYLPTHLLTNTALYCTMSNLKSLSRLDDQKKMRFALISLAFVVKVRSVSVHGMKRVGRGTNIAIQSMESSPNYCLSVFVSVHLDATATLRLRQRFY
jgi:hypothetical protein